MEEVEAETFVSMAFVWGARAGQMPESERCFMQSKELKTGCVSVYYKEAILIFGEDETCITMYRAPGWFRDRYGHGRKNWNRNMRYAYAEVFVEG